MSCEEQSLDSALGTLVCGQIVRNEATTTKEVRHGCSMVYFDTYGQAQFRSTDAPSGYLTYSLALYHQDGRKLTEDEIAYVQTAIDRLLSHYGTEHSIACIDSHYDMLVARKLRISNPERGHAATDPAHLDGMAQKYARSNDTGLSQISFRIPVEGEHEQNYQRLLAVMNEVNQVAPKRSFGPKGFGNK
ncbi:MAG: hypothetical protein ACKVOE_08090 [Rickettsiales bacterium]